LPTGIDAGYKAIMSDWMSSRKLQWVINTTFSGRIMKLVSVTCGISNRVFAGKDICRDRAIYIWISSCFTKVGPLLGVVAIISHAISLLDGSC